MIGNGATELLQTAAYLLLSRRRRAGDALAVVPALPADRRARGRRGPSPWTSPAGARRPRGAARRRHRPDARRGDLQPERPDRRPTWPSRDARRLLVAAARPRPRPARRGLRPVPGRRARGRVLRLVDAFPHLLVFRTFSKIYGLSGLRAGYAVGSPTRPRAAGALAPVLASTRSPRPAVAQALTIGDREIGRRRRARDRAARAAAGGAPELPVDAPAARPTSSGCAPPA